MNFSNWYSGPLYQGFLTKGWKGANGNCSRMGRMDKKHKKFYKYKKGCHNHLFIYRCSCAGGGGAAVPSPPMCGNPGHSPFMSDHPGKLGTTLRSRKSVYIQHWTFSLTAFNSSLGIQNNSSLVICLWSEEQHKQLSKDHSFWGAVHLINTKKIY